VTRDVTPGSMCLTFSLSILPGKDCLVALS
jgi:hypothetical protein